ncbi:peptidase M16 inactive domain-containing protein [Kalaharituber pfeilii]|nr:peptidase M16 inactive domain-containing protein [Kalaharituber pfeilii]
MLRSASASKAIPRLLRRPSPVSNSVSSRFCTQRRSLASAATSLPTRDTSELDAVTILPNGIKVATEALPGHFSGLGVYIDAGSRYETDRLRGVSHLIDRLAFKSTRSRTADKMLETLESLGGNIQCASSRESLMYQAAVFNHQVPNMLALLAETVREPLITQEEVVQQLETAAYEINEIWAKPDLILPELMHTTAYKDNTLGHPLLCPEDRLDVINRDLIMEYRDLMYRPERIVIAFAGVDHDTAVKLTEKYFGDMKASPTISPAASTTSASFSTNYPIPPPSRSSSPALLNKIPFFKSLSTTASSAASLLTSTPPSPTPINTIDPFTQPSHYTGGILSLPPPTNRPSIHNPALTHLQIAFEALPISHPDIYALATLQTLLGGGGSFSAGGPGKGMYSRLYTQVLNQHGWVESCIAFNNSYTDSGLFGIAASCVPNAGHALVDVIMRQFRNTYATSGPAAIEPQELSRAKNQLRSSLLMNLESRMVELEDLGRQVQVHGRKIGAQEMSEKIQMVTMEDVRRVAETVFTGKVRNLGKGKGGATVVISAAGGECMKCRNGHEKGENGEVKGRF